MKTIELQANGYTFEAHIDENHHMGEFALTMPITLLVSMIQNSLETLNVTPENIDEMNSGSTWFNVEVVA